GFAQARLAQHQAGGVVDQPGTLEPGDRVAAQRRAARQLPADRDTDHRGTRPGAERPQTTDLNGGATPFGGRLHIGDAAAAGAAEPAWAGTGASGGAVLAALGPELVLPGGALLASGGLGRLLSGLGAEGLAPQRGAVGSVRCLTGRRVDGHSASRITAGTWRWSGSTTPSGSAAVKAAA